MSLEQFIGFLNQDLMGEFSSVAAYTTYAAIVAGLHHMELSEEFEEEAQDELEHATLLSKRIAALGGIPKPIIKPAPIVSDPSKIVPILLSMEKQAVRDYSIRVEQAHSIGLHGIAVELENILADEQDHHDILIMMI